MTEVIAVTLDGQARVPEDLTEAQSEIAVGEVDEAQAARSKTTAPSIASIVSS